MPEEKKIDAKQVKELRDLTGVGIMECKHALEECDGDAEKAIHVLRERGMARARKRQEQVADQGVVDSYLHIGRQIGAMVELNCETDFVARNAEFVELAHTIAMHVAACNPRYLDRESIPSEVVDSEKKEFKAQAEALGKPEKVHDSIVEGKMEKYFQEVCLLEQPYIKDPSISIEELLAQASSRLGEKVAIGKYCRFMVGENRED